MAISGWLLRGPNVYTFCNVRQQLLMLSINPRAPHHPLVNLFYLHLGLIGRRVKFDGKSLISNFRLIVHKYAILYTFLQLHFSSLAALYDCLTRIQHILFRPLIRATSAKADALLDVTGRRYLHFNWIGEPNNKSYKWIMNSSSWSNWLLRFKTKWFLSPVVAARTVQRRGSRALNYWQNQRGMTKRHADHGGPSGPDEELFVSDCVWGAQTDSWWHICPAEVALPGLTETLPNRWACNCVWFNDRENKCCFLFMMVHWLTSTLMALSFLHWCFNEVTKRKWLFQALTAREMNLS